MDDDVARAEALARSAAQDQRGGRLDQAFAAASQAAEIYAEIGAGADAALCDRLAARVLRRLGRLDEARDRIGRSRVGLEQAAASALDLASCDLVEAEIDHAAGDHAAAAVLLRRAQAVYLRLRRPLLAAICAHNLGVVSHQSAERHGDGDTARLAEAREVFLAHRRTREVATCDYNLGVLAHDEGRHDDAIDDYQRARDVFTATDRRHAAASCDQNLAVVLHELGRHGEATQRLEAACDTFREMGDAQAAASCEHNLRIAREAAAIAPDRTPAP